MSTKQIQQNKRLTGIFMPYAKRRIDSLQRGGKRMVHYTSAENLFRIISSKTLWMRSTHCMSDYREVEHGHSLLLQFFQEGTNRTDFCAALNVCSAGVGEESLQLFDQWWVNIRFNTYIASISEHEKDEDLHGRLSMWRAFGQQGRPRAAAVLKMPAPGSAEAFHLNLSPVAYFDYPNVRKEFLKLIDNIKKNTKFLQALPRDNLKRVVFFALVSAAVSLKHEGFREEKEWRIIYLPQAYGSPLIRMSLEVLDGIPQPIYQIPLENDPANSISGISIVDLVDRIIIGPTSFGVPIIAAFVQQLREAGVADAESRVVFSGIPIRS